MIMHYKWESLDLSIDKTILIAEVAPRAELNAHLKPPTRLFGDEERRLFCKQLINNF